MRLMATLYLITGLFIVYSPAYLYVKLMIFLFFLTCSRHHLMNKSPCKEIQELRLSQSQCILITKDGQLIYFDKVIILVHNTLFQLIKLTSPANKKLFVLFNDQIPMEQLRLLHVKAGIY